MFNIRNESTNFRRLVSYSKDGATAWTPPVYADAFFEPICFASMVRYSKKPLNQKNRIIEKQTLLFNHPEFLRS